MKCKDCPNLRDMVTYDENGQPSEPIYYCRLDPVELQFGINDYETMSCYMSDTDTFTVKNVLDYLDEVIREYDEKIDLLKKKLSHGETISGESGASILLYDTLNSRFVVECIRKNIERASDNNPKCEILP